MQKSMYILAMIYLIIPGYKERIFPGVPFNNVFQEIALSFLILIGIRKIFLYAIGQTKPKENFFQKKIQSIMIFLVISLIAVKLINKPNFIKPCFIANEFKNSTCKENIHPEIESIDWQPKQGKHWIISSFNTLNYNIYGRRDKPGKRREEFRRTRSHPFTMKAEFNASNIKGDLLTLWYTGQIKTEVKNKKGKAEIYYGTFSKDKKNRIKVPIKDKESIITLSYKNYTCNKGWDDTKFCQDEMTHKSISLDHSLLYGNVKIHDYHVFKYLHISIEILFLFLLLLFLFSKTWPIYKSYLSTVFSKQWLNLNIQALLRAFFISSAVFYLFIYFYRVSFSPPAWIISALSIFCAGVFFISFSFSKKNIKIIDERYKYFNIIILDFCFIVPSFVLFTTTYLYQLPILGYKLDYSQMHLFSVGDDHLTYSSWALHILNTKSFFYDSSTVFSKPFFLYFRALLILIFGESFKPAHTFQYLAFYLFPLFILTSFFLRENLRRIKNISELSISFYDKINSILAFLIVVWVLIGVKDLHFFTYLSEWPSWFFGILASCFFLLALNNIKNQADVALGSLERRNFTLFLFFSALSLLMRVNHLFVFSMFLPVYFLVLAPKDIVKNSIKTVLAYAAVGSLIIIHFFSSESVTSINSVISYLNANTGNSTNTSLLEIFNNLQRIIHDKALYFFALIYFLFVLLSMIFKVARLKAFILISSYFLCFIIVQVPMSRTGYYPRTLILPSWIFALCSYFVMERISRILERKDIRNQFVNRYSLLKKRGLSRMR